MLSTCRATIDVKRCVVCCVCVPFEVGLLVMRDREALLPNHSGVTLQLSQMSITGEHLIQLTVKRNRSLGNVRNRRHLDDT